jgi:hypothetical protein
MNETDFLQVFLNIVITNESKFFYNLKKILGHDNLSMFKNLLKYRHESKKQVCDSFTYFRGQI